MSKKHRFPNDPHAARERQKYEQPIPSREYILSVLKKHKKLLSKDQLYSALGVDNPNDKEALRNRLRAMERAGQVVCNRRGDYGLPSKMNLMQGRVSGHREGFGFVVSDEGRESLYLNPREMRRVMEGDKVLASVIGVDRKGRPEGKVVDVLERGLTHIVGRYTVKNGVAFVRPYHQRLSQDVLVARMSELKVTDGQLVNVKITQYPSYRSQAIGEIVEVLSSNETLQLNIDIATRSYAIPHHLPAEVQEEIKAFGKTVNQDAIVGRADYRELPFVTIDGEDAKDFDDAVYCEVKNNGTYKLYVAIADVSHYVKPGTALDTEAARRGNSVYFPNHVVPMLPEVLSNGLCSLKPKVDRLAKVCVMDIDAQGNIKKYHFVSAVIRSKARLTYAQVAAFLDDKGELEASLAEPIMALFDVYQTLKKARRARGAINFETIETLFRFKANGDVKEIIPYHRTQAHMLIEECMLAANEATALFLIKHRLPALFRVHGKPQAEKIQDLREFLGIRGLHLKGGKQPTPKDFCNTLKQAQGRADAMLVQHVVLRSMCLSVYSPDNVGHFGLAYDAYVQFTSPIRRYPDLFVHRILKAYERGEKPIHVERYTPQLEESTMSLAALGDHCSMTERRADEATRDVESALKCEYIQAYIGDRFEGVVSGVTPFGLFVNLIAYYVEGLVHISSLDDDYYNYDPIHHTLTGERTAKQYQWGQSVQVKLVHVNVDERKIDLELDVRAKRKKASKKKLK